MTEIVLPQHANAVGTAFGGTVMSWIDVCAAVTAHRHCRRVAVTASVDDLHFRAPLRVGDVVVLESRVNAVFNTSLEVGVRVDREDPSTRLRIRSRVEGSSRSTRTPTSSEVLNTALTRDSRTTTSPTRNGARK